MNNVNSHIEKYLNEYFESQHNPKFAVMLQGEWGCGKTWFIKKLIDHYQRSPQKPLTTYSRPGFLNKPSKDDNQKEGLNREKRFLYISLYSVESVNEIENQIFQQLHPLLSSKPMAITGKILQGVLRSNIHIDFDMGSNTKGNIDANISDMNIPSFLKNADDRIFIFDDFERCLMTPSRTLGYINSFVEHHGLRVIIVANEEKVKRPQKSKSTNNDNKEEQNGNEKLNYSEIKEKLIGKTFRIKADVESAFDSFVKEIGSLNFKGFVKNSKEHILGIFEKANYNNLRHLQQSLWEFERIYPDIPEKFKDIPDLILDLISVFLVYSFEIKAGKIEPTDIIDYSSYRIKKYSKSLRHPTNEGKKEISEPIDEVIEKYDFLESSGTILPVTYWKKLFDNGYLSKEAFEESLSNSRYCQDDNTPEWVKLWHHRDLEDDEFEHVLKNVRTQWQNREFTKPGLILHVAGLFLGLSEIGLFQSSKEEILEESKKYIDDIKKSKKWTKQDLSKDPFSDKDQWGGLGYAGQELKEFQEINDYLEDKIQRFIFEGLPDEGNQLLSALSNDLNLFRDLIAPEREIQHSFHSVPIFKYLDPKEFLRSLLKVENSSKKTVAYALKARYRYDYTAKSLIEELDFLKNLKSEIDRAIEKRKGKISGYLLGFINNPYLNDIITKLEGFKAELGEAEKV